MIYQIRVKGHLGNQWSDWFEGLTIVLEDDGNTIISGSVLDDAALHGLLKRVRDLGMQLISVNRIESDLKNGSDIECEPVPEPQKSNLKLNKE
jgi:hypothetical protein